MRSKKIHRGALIAKPGTVYDFEEITGYIDASGADTKTAFPKLTAVGGSIYASGADTKTAFPKLTAVGGYIDASGADTKTAFPTLTTVGGNIEASGIDASGADHISQNDGFAITKCRRNIFEANLKIGYYYVDGILARLVNRKGRVARVILIGKTETSYVVNDDNGNYSHGATLKEARDGLIYKLSSRDTGEFKKWKVTTNVTLADAIKAYRAITGACESGTRHFCEQAGKLPEKMTVADAIGMTKGQFGNDVFAAFFSA
jgi:hypothetical protein